MENEMYQEYLNQGEVLVSAGRYEEAMAYLRKAEQEEPNHTELYINMGIALVNLERLDEAEKTFKKALFVDKKCGEAQFHIGCLAGLKGDLEQGIKNIEMAQNNGYRSAQTFYTLGMMFEEQENDTMALRNYNKALAEDPVRADIHLQKCNLLIKGGRREEVLEALDAMLLNCPDYFEGYHLKCATLAELERYEEAEKVLDAGLELFPKEIGFQVDKAKILIHQEQYEKAQEILEKIEKEDSQWLRDILLEEVRIAGLQENYERTSSLLERAYKECRMDNHPDEEICYLLLSVYMTGKQYDKVLTMAEEFIGLSENSTYINIAHFYRAEALNQTGEKEKAKEEYEDTIRRCRAAALENPAALDAYLLRGLSLNRLGQNDKALEMIDYIIALAPESAEAHSAKALVLKDMGRTEEMDSEIQKVNEIGGQLSNIMSAL